MTTPNTARLEALSEQITCAMGRVLENHRAAGDMLLEAQQIFDSGLTKAKMSRLEDVTQQIRAATRRAVEDDLAAGVHLLEAEKLLSPDLFLTWVENDAGLEREEAQRKMRAAETYAQDGPVAALPWDVVSALNGPLSEWMGRRVERMARLFDSEA